MLKKLKNIIRYCRRRGGYVSRIVRVLLEFTVEAAVARGRFHERYLHRRRQQVVLPRQQVARRGQRFTPPRPDTPPIANLRTHVITAAADRIENYYKVFISTRFSDRRTRPTDTHVHYRRSSSITFYFILFVRVYFFFFHNYFYFVVFHAELVGRLSELP